tara:strand:+ start:149 stop:310 length:162 start_codon:yes stop_codon:yes gene_type:complete
MTVTTVFMSIMAWHDNEDKYFVDRRLVKNARIFIWDTKRNSIRFPPGGFEEFP